jgi:adenosine deaminase
MVSPRTAPARVDEQVIRSMPKAELHVHLEGSFSLLDLLTLARENGVPLPGPAATLFDVATHDAFTMPEVTTGGGSGVGVGGLSGFLRFLDWQCGLVRTADQAARVAYSFAARQSRSGVRYTDVIVNPTHWNGWRGREFALMEALASGFAAAEQDGLCVVNIAYSLLRSQGATEAETIVSDLVESRLDRVVALSVDGDEKVSGRTGEKFRAAFTLAGRRGLRRTAHAGESSGPDGVWDAIELLGVERVDHGIRSIEDPALVSRLIDDDITLDVCPRSNVSLGLYPDWESHPLPQLVAAGVPITLNTDDPSPLGTTLETDWSVASVEFGFGVPELTGFAARSIEASFADEDLKRALRNDLAAWIDENSAGKDAEA